MYSRRRICVTLEVAAGVGEGRIGQKVGVEFGTATRGVSVFENMPLGGLSSEYGRGVGE